MSAIKGPLPAPFAAALCHSLAAVGPAHHRARGAALAPIERAQAAARTPAAPQRLEGPRATAAADVLTVARLLATRGAQAPDEHATLQQAGVAQVGPVASEGSLLPYPEHDWTVAPDSAIISDQDATPDQIAYQLPY